MAQTLNGISDVYFNGVSCRTYGIISETIPENVLPERMGEEITIPGRSGSLFVDGGGWKDIERSYNFAILLDTYNMMKLTTLPDATNFHTWHPTNPVVKYVGETTSTRTKGAYYHTVESVITWAWEEVDAAEVVDSVAKAKEQFSKWLYGANGFCNMSDSYNSGVHWKGRFKGGTVTNVTTDAVRMTATFTCHPKMFYDYTDGAGKKQSDWHYYTEAIVEVVHTSANPSGNTAYPLITINAKNVTIDIQQLIGSTWVTMLTVNLLNMSALTSVTIDCERHIVYKTSDSSNLNSLVTVGNYGWPTIGVTEAQRQIKIARRYTGTAGTNNYVYWTEVEPRTWKI